MQALAFSLHARNERVHWLAPAQAISACMHETLLQAAAEELGGGLLELIPERDERLSALMYALHVEHASDFARGGFFASAIEQGIAISLDNHHNASAPAKPHPVSGLPPSCARRVADYIHGHLDQPLPVEALAQCAGFSRAHFSRLFHASFSTTPHQYVMNARIELAKSMLLAGQESILEIALACGFQTSQHFARNFRSLTGLNPISFRKQHG
ncbi:helix-turn-helix domain-containing protein [Pseudomonas sp. NPDC089554]|uniref:helix-turn-helix domain-containing protein n=1 Tax=Pseudomonas sp. NPDC089554 TaxID=3390653 RepID=UPI003CFC9DEC